MASLPGTAAGAHPKKISALEALQPDARSFPRRSSRVRNPITPLFPSNASTPSHSGQVFRPEQAQAAETPDLPTGCACTRPAGPVALSTPRGLDWPAPSYTKAFLNGLSRTPACPSWSNSRCRDSTGILPLTSRATKQVVDRRVRSTAGRRSRQRLHEFTGSVRRRTACDHTS